MYKATPVTFILFWLNILIMSFTFFFSKSLSPNIQILQYMGALSHNDYSLHLLSYMFLHSGYVHLLLNMLALLICGKKVEGLIGSAAFFVTYMISGLVGGIFAAAFGAPNAITVGASGAIIGIVACELAIRLKYRAYKSKVGRNDLFALSFDILFIMFISTLPIVSGAAHFGGFLAGFIMTFFFHSVAPQESLTRWSDELNMNNIKNN